VQALSGVHPGKAQTAHRRCPGALQVLEVLDACERSLRNGGSPVEFNGVETSYSTHSTAVIDSKCEIGATQKSGTSRT